LMLIDFTGVMDPKDSEDKKQTRGLKRPFGVAGLFSVFCT